MDLHSIQATDSVPYRSKLPTSTLVDGLFVRLVQQFRESYCTIPRQPAPVVPSFNNVTVHTVGRTRLRSASTSGIDYCLGGGRCCKCQT